MHGPLRGAAQTPSLLTQKLAANISEHCCTPLLTHSGPCPHLLRQGDDIFSRSFWDETVKSKRSDRFYKAYREPLTGGAWGRRGPGFQQVPPPPPSPFPSENWRWTSTSQSMLIFPLIGLWAALQRDYALRNAAWHVVDIFAEMNESTGRRDGFTDPLDVHLRPGPEGIAPADMGSPEQATSDVKLVSRTLGASLVGVTAVDERWQYRTRFAGPDGQGGPQQPAPHRPPGCWHAINAALSVSGGGGVCRSERQAERYPGELHDRHHHRAGDGLASALDRSLRAVRCSHRAWLLPRRGRPARGCAVPQEPWWAIN